MLRITIKLEYRENFRKTFENITRKSIDITENFKEILQKLEKSETLEKKFIEDIESIFLSAVLRNIFQSIINIC